MKNLFIIKTGTAFPDTAEKYGDFDCWTKRGLGDNENNICVIDAEHGDKLPDADYCRGIIITGSHSMVTDKRSWSEGIAEWIPSIIEREIPFLGICYGHQLLAYAAGGKIGFHPLGKEIGTVEIRVLPASQNDPLFSFLPETFPAHVTHAQTILSLPENCVCLAENPFEKTHAFRIGRCAWGVQFHPEYDTDIMKSYILNQAEEIKDSGKDINSLLNQVRETPEANNILQKFLSLINYKIT